MPTKPQASTSWYLVLTFSGVIFSEDYKKLSVSSPYRANPLLDKFPLTGLHKNINKGMKKTFMSDLLLNVHK